MASPSHMRRLYRSVRAVGIGNILRPQVRLTPCDPCWGSTEIDQLGARQGPPMFTGARTGPDASAPHQSVDYFADGSSGSSVSSATGGTGSGRRVRTACEDSVTPLKSNSTQVGCTRFKGIRSTQSTA